MARFKIHSSYVLAMFWQERTCSKTVKTLFESHDHVEKHPAQSEYTASYSYIELSPYQRENSLHGRIIGGGRQFIGSFLIQQEPVLLKSSPC